MTHDFLGIGWNYPVTAREGEGPLSAELAHNEDSVQQSIWIILSTARGERVMRPDFGCGIHNLVFALDNASTAGLVRHEVEQSLLFWEPRINVLSVSVNSERTRESDLNAAQREYKRFRETEARRRLRSMPYAAREALRQSLQSAEPVAGPEVTGLLLDRIAETEFPVFDIWLKEVRQRIAGPTLLISIEYRVKATNSRFNVVYPFYLERSASRNA